MAAMIAKCEAQGVTILAMGKVIAAARALVRDCSPFNDGDFDALRDALEEVGG